MKIMHVVEGFGGGVYSFLVDLCNSLCESNEVILVYSEREQTPKNFKDDFNKKIRLINLEMSRAISVKVDGKAFFSLLSLIKKEKPDVIHLHSSKAGALGRLSSKLLGYSSKNVFYNPHGYAFLQEDISNKKRKFYYYVEKILAKINGTIIAVSKGEYEESLKLTKKSIRIDNAIDNEELDKVITESTYKSKPTIGTIGRISYQKNPKAFNEVAKKFPDLEFIWIGDGDLRNELTEKNIKITGWMDRYEAIKLMNKLDIYLQPSLWEGLPIALLEAMYMGKPTIVNNVIGNKDVIVNNVNGFISNSIEDYEKYINELKDNKDKYEEISKKAKEYIVQNHLVKDMINKYVQAYNR
ncbi:MAG: glycosyltransferase family 4 protein [Clostridiales bacterium]|nr:glycosyltransferase family 4 protein [Clostridiales bacterium]